MTLYNLHTSDLGYVITKFDSLGNIESSYTTSHEACECPAGHRHTCRHRQMLPQMLGIADTHWFFDYERGQIVDINGTLKSNLDRMLAVSQQPALDRIPTPIETLYSEPKIGVYARVPDVEDTAKDTAEDAPTVDGVERDEYLAGIMDAMDIIPTDPTPQQIHQIKKPWRRI